MRRYSLTALACLFIFAGGVGAQTDGIKSDGETVIGVRDTPDAVRRPIEGKIVNRASQGALFSDAVAALKLMPGVASRGTFDSRLIVRGGNDNELVLVVDDVPMYRPFFFGGRMTILDARLAKTLDFYPGGYSVRGGQALSGIIDYHLKDGDFVKRGGEFEWNITEASFRYSNPIEVNKSTLFVAGRRTYYDIFAPLFINRSDGPVAMPFIQTLEAKYTDKISLNETRSMGFHFFNDGANTPLDAVGADTDSKTGQLIYNNSRMLLSGQQEINWSPTVRNQFTVAFGNTRSRARITNDQKIDSATEVSDYTLRDDIIFSEVPDHEIRVGTILHYSQLGLNTSAHVLPDPEFPGSVTRNATFHYSGSYRYAGAYLEDNWDWMPQSTLTLGYRLDAAHIPGQAVKWGGQPRMAITWESSDATKWKAYWGTFRQQKIITDSRLNLDGSISQSLSDLAQDRAVHYGLELSHYFAPKLMGSMALFYKQYDLLAANTATFPEEINSNSAAGSAVGIECLLHQFKTVQMEGWLTYTYTNARLNTPKHGWHSPDYDIPHVFNAFGEFATASGNLTMVFTASSGTRYTPVLSSQPDPQTGAAVYTYDGYLSRRLTPYVRLDIWHETPGADVVIPIPFLPGGDEQVWGIFPKYKLNGKTRIGIYNILAIRNSIGYTYDKTTQTSGLVYDFPIMPIFGETIYF